MLHDGHTGSLIPSGNNGLGLSGEYSYYHYADIIRTEGAQVLATYGSDFYQGQPALTINHYGSGKAYYMASRNDTCFLSDFYRGLSTQLGLKPALLCDLPDGVTAQVRRNENVEFVFLMNFTPNLREVHLDVAENFTIVKYGTEKVDGVKLAGYEVCILKRIISN